MCRPLLVCSDDFSKRHFQMHFFLALLGLTYKYKHKIVLQFHYRVFLKMDKNIFYDSWSGTSFCGIDAVRCIQNFHQRILFDPTFFILSATEISKHIIKALRVLMETTSCDFSSCRLSRVHFCRWYFRNIFKFVYCIFFWPMMKEKFDMISIFSF